MQASQGNPTQEITKFLAGGVGSVTAIFGGIGALSGGLERVVRNYPALSIVLLGATALLVALGVLAPALSHKIPDWILAIGVGGLIVVGGIFGALIVSGTSTSERPRVDGSLSATQDQLTIKGSVEASGLKSDEHMLIRVEGHSTEEPLAEFHAGKPRSKTDPPDGSTQEGPVTDHLQLVYAARVGPDGGGKVKAPIDTVVARKLYERIVISGQLQGRAGRGKVTSEVRRCDETTRFWGCAQLMAPDR